MKSFTCCAALLAALWGAVWALAGATAAPALTWREQFARDVLKGLGNERPSGETVGFMVSWTLAEDRSDGAWQRFNPLNTTQPSRAETDVINSDGVRGYATYADGLAATLQTLTNGYYDALVAALRENDAVGAYEALVASPWAASHYADGWPAVVVSSPLPLADDAFGYNVRGALDANGGALLDVVIRPGEVWSFNAAMGDPAAIAYTTVAGVPGGGWCDLAARYLQVARELGAELSYHHHGLQLAGVAWEDSIAIWNEGGQAGGQDLIIRNTTARILRLRVEEAGVGLVQVRGWVE